MNEPVGLSAERHQRHTHLVGSLPFADANESMSESLSRLGDLLLYLSDGETAERGDYVSHLADQLGSNPALKGKKTGDHLSRAARRSRSLSYSTRQKVCVATWGTRIF